MMSWKIDCRLVQTDKKPERHRHWTAAARDGEKLAEALKIEGFQATDDWRNLAGAIDMVVFNH